MGIEANTQNRWRTARERNRLKARYEVQSRIASLVHHQRHQIGVGDALLDVDGCRDDVCGAVGEESLATTAYNSNNDELSLEDINTILIYLQAVIKNDLSAFSVASLARHGHLLNKPLPTISTTTTPASATVDLAGGIPKNGIDTREGALFALSMFLSTAQMERNAPSPSTSSTLPSTAITPNDTSLQPQPATLATSKFGADFVHNRLLPYMQHRQHNGQQLTLVEYASLLGRHGIVSLLLLGGVDPTLSGLEVMCDSYGSGIDRKSIQTSTADMASRKVLALLHSLNVQSADDDKQQSIDGSSSSVGGSSSFIPMSLWCYLIRAMIEMRMASVLDTQPQSTSKCSVCNRQHTKLLPFGSPCNHTICEPCIWIHLADTVPVFTDVKRDVVTCPTCSAEFEGDFHCRKRASDGAHASFERLSLQLINHESKDGEDEHIDVTQQRHHRRLESLAKFKGLPVTSFELKSKKKRKRIKDPIHSTWEEALQTLIDGHRCQDVRSDRFFRSVISSPQLVIGYLNAGIDVNMTNDYGQTPLYLSCWKGSALIVQSLLEYGADISIAANGGSTCRSVAEYHGRNDIAQLLERYGDTLGTIKNHASLSSTLTSPNTYEVSFLIEPTTDHPGRGALVVDSALTEHQLQQLEALLDTLPISKCVETNEVADSTKDKSVYRPTRSYYCDAEETIQTMLEGCVEAARDALAKEGCLQSDSVIHDTGRKPPTSVFQHLRFLRYERKGGILPPHVDLCRVDDASGCRSTHTFILYLTDCENGGGTALLQHLKEPTVLTIAQPRRGRALIFPHLCPHSGLEVDCVPKVLLRGEVFLEMTS